MRFVGKISALAFLVAGAAQAEPVAIVNARVHTAGAAGTLEPATVVFDQGKILAVGKDVAVPAGARRIDAAGKEVTPGLANAHTGLGAIELESIDQTNDLQNGTPHYGAGEGGQGVASGYSVAFNIAEAINPASTAIPVNRILGLTRAVVVPHSDNSLFQGQASAIHLGLGTELVVNAKAAVFADLTESGVEAAGGSRALALEKLRQAFAEARHFAEHKDDFLPAPKDYLLSEADREALLPVLEGQLPLVVAVNRASDIRNVLKLKAVEPKLRLVVADGAEAWMVAEELAKAGVPVLLDPMANLPGSFDRLGAHLEGPARLAQAGVKLLFRGEDTHKAFLVRQGAGNAVANGLAYDEALKAMTVNIAEVFGMPGYGAIEAGKDADLVIWDGDPLEVTTEAEQVFIRGEAMPMVSRATRLRDRYRDPSGAAVLPPAYRH